MSYSQEENIKVIEDILGINLRTRLDGKLKCDSLDFLRRVFEVLEEQNIADFDNVVDRAELKR